MKRQTYILGCGNKVPKEKPEGFVYVDAIAWEGVDVVMDLEQQDWPFPDGSAKHINATHVLEHISGLKNFMEECHRMLMPGGTFYIEVPSAGNIDLAFSDPTHVRQFTKHTFINYLTVEGVHNFGYFKNAWSILHLHETGGVIRAHLMPIPDGALTDETLLMLNNTTNDEDNG